MSERKEEPWGKGLLCGKRKGSVLDVEMTILDKQPKGIAIDE